MPTTVNGIGTHYYGKKNVEVRQGICQSCQRTGQLTSYDTRLWFVVIFIPIIPLGRKRIIDQCPSCSRHYAMNADQFQMAKQLNVSGALDKYRTTPTPENAIEAHGQLIGFHQFEEATEFRNTVLKEYATNAELFVNLGLQLQYCGQTEEANKLLDVGYQLRPDLPVARVAMARRRMRESKLDEARGLLDFLEQRGAGQLHSLEPLDELAGAYQHAGRHEEAISVCRHLLEEFPVVAQHYQFRQFVKRSEKALRRTESILPKPEFSWRTLFDPKSNTVSPGKRWAAIAGMVAVVATVVLAINNEYTRRHRRVTVVNAFGVPAKIDFDGKNAISVAGTKEVVLPEGTHRATISGPVNDQVDFELRTNYFQRWFSRPVWLLNVGGKQTFSFTRIYYAANPPPSTPEFIIGQNFTYLEHVDYPFTSPPSTVQVEGSQQVVKTHLEKTPASDLQLLHYLETNRGPDAALSFAESRLRFQSPDETFINFYAITAFRLNQPERAREFLKAGLTTRPVSIPWHRAYQNLSRNSGDNRDLAGEYDKLLKQEPKNGALYYLRGRLSENASEGKQFFQRAITEDPSLAWPWYALAYDAASSGKWQACADHLKKAEALKLKRDVYEDLLHACRLGLGDAVKMSVDYRQHLSSNSPGEVAQTLIHLCDVLFTLNQSEEAWAEFSKWQNSIAGVPQKQEVEDSVRFAIEYMGGNLEKLCQPPPQPRTLNDYFQLHALLALRRGDEALKNARFQNLLKDSWNALSLATVLEINGNAEQAKAWREQASVAFEKGTSETQVAKVLRSETPPLQDELDNITLSTQHKALLFAALAVQHPMQREKFLEQANHMNVLRSPPYHLVQSLVMNPQ